MKLDKLSIEATIKNKIIEIADTLGCDAKDLQPDEIIPATGLIDSAGLLELIAWYESYYDISIPTSEFTVENLGTLSSMAEYLLQRKQ
jgi:D-alanine--poly(phosphoribitol) ligase subunit 2